MKQYPTTDSVDSKTLDWTKYKIVVPRQEDYDELKAAFEHFHYSDIDTNFIVVNQLAHEYLDKEHGENYKNNIIIDPIIYSALNDMKL